MDSSYSSPIASVRPAVDAELTAFLEQRSSEVHRIGTELAPVLQALDALLSGGKRMRPAFCYWGWRGAGGTEDPAVYTAAASLEFLQACALIHDDVIDNSDTRRGLPSTHRRLAELHEKAGWRGDAAEFGRGAAVLLGDLCLSWCEDMYAGSALPAEALRAGRKPFADMRTEVMAGQFLDMVEQVRETSSTEAPQRVMHYKSAKYTVERPLQLGAALAGRYEELAPVYSSYGIPLGTAFQLRDDILGVFGDPEQTGKPAGDDLREGKRTLLVAETLQRVDTTTSDRFQQLLGEPELSDPAVEWMRDLVESSGALAACERRIEEYVENANRALDRSRITDDARRALSDLIVAATARKH
ncbi:geranylgeranyl diphosphate synthase type I [Haloactinospora alba]|uniref:Geranylgeranyl diphosphate synthase type I n=1 Tax=Haloactinospora alba TaxID=405555 RepID=A0A543NHL0_9ACTN|nr:polyprenyl synthetase family protein [Haloactinospora alba]TQN31336.1 geranylgeranyl diphosphate synthase type I [Haloactinospora alba]